MIFTILVLFGAFVTVIAIIYITIAVVKGIRRSSKKKEAKRLLKGKEDADFSASVASIEKINKLIDVISNPVGGESNMREEDRDLIEQLRNLRERKRKNNKKKKEEKPEKKYDVELIEVGSNKISIIKIVRDITGKGLRESKELVDDVPQLMIRGVAEKEARMIKERLEKAGAKIKLR